jgi:hypothetical protein
MPKQYYSMRKKDASDLLTSVGSRPVAVLVLETLVKLEAVPGSFQRCLRLR